MIMTEAEIIKLRKNIMEKDGVDEIEAGSRINSFMIQGAKINKDLMARIEKTIRDMRIYPSHKELVLSNIAMTILMSEVYKYKTEKDIDGYLERLANWLKGSWEDKIKQK